MNTSEELLHLGNILEYVMVSSNIMVIVKGCTQ